jgi:hypothetical protein
MNDPLARFKEGMRDLIAESIRLMIRKRLERVNFLMSENEMKVRIPKGLKGADLERAKIQASLMSNRGKTYDVKKPGAKTLARMELAKLKAKPHVD